MYFCFITVAIFVTYSNFIMSAFSLEEDGYFISESQPDPDDPFQILDKKISEKTNVYVDQYSDISDDDFEIPCSQKRMSSRLVTVLF